MISKGANESTILAELKSNGMRTIYGYADEAVGKGITNRAEVSSVIGVKSDA